MFASCLLGGLSVLLPWGVLRISMSAAGLTNGFRFFSVDTFQQLFKPKKTKGNLILCILAFG